MGKASKGSAFERSFCVLLSAWWTQDDETGPRSDVFWRTSTSGGRAKTRGRKGKATKGQSGDIAAIDPVGAPFIDLFTLELKRGYSKATIADLLDKPKKGAEQIYEKWFAQAEESRVQAGTPYWMIVAQRNRRDPIVFLPGTVTNHFMQIEESWPWICMCFKTKDKQTHEVIGLKLKAFLRYAKPADIIKVEKGLRKK